MQKFIMLNVFGRLCWLAIFFLLAFFGGVNFSGGINVNASDDFPYFQLPAPTGTFSVGTQGFHFEDDLRLEEISPEPDDHRQIQVRIWYPAYPYTRKPLERYMSDQFIASLTQGVDMNSTLETILARVETHAHSGALPAYKKGPFPLLLFSPGFGANYQSYQSLIEEIVSHGYVIAAVNHPYISGFTKLSDGSIVQAVLPDFEELSTEEEKVAWMTRLHPIVVDDMKFLIETLTVERKWIYKHLIDMDTLGLLGHSLGGSAAVEACLQLPQCKASMDIDGRLFGERHQQKFDMPLFLMLSEGHCIKATCKDKAELYSQTLDTAGQNMGQYGYILHLNSAVHNTFSDFGTLLQQAVDSDYFDSTINAYLEQMRSQYGAIDGELAVDITRAYAVAFFDAHLKKAPLENIAALSYPEATFEMSADLD